ncbi:hypothetical protein [Streptomyces sp. NBC_00094]|uniref:hypothetical protein n=1 Tax=Streptomyces sp. NBC_00094 TaxID=2903620 RepID=UPI00224E5AC6|nr:hypothetical protein [Streptomyces sp. NBC_00094]MCX5395108.1 hypothetical protein [Streptomyces sp. NBC_00094]
MFVSAPHSAERAAGVAWPRVVRLGAPRPGPAARRARWFGVPLVPLLLAALVVGGFTAVGGWGDHEGAAYGEPGGGPEAVPAPAVTEQDAAGTRTPKADAPPTGAPVTGTPAGDTPTNTPTSTPEGGATAAATEKGSDPQQGESASPDSSRTPSTAPATTRPAASTAPTGTRPPARPVSFEALRVGDCFDIDRDTPGTALRRSCNTPHDAELVARPRLTGSYADDQRVREAATELCRVPLRDKAALQPLGTRWTTFVQYPYRTSYLLGSDTAACSLAARSASGDKLTARLR